MRLSEVPIGGKASIVEIVLPVAAQEYLMRRGFVPGTEVEVVRRGPLKGPMVYRIQGTETAIRAETAERIQVEMGAAGDAETE